MLSFGIKGGPEFRGGGPKILGGDYEPQWCHDCLFYFENYFSLYLFRPQAPMHCRWNIATGNKFCSMLNPITPIAHKNGQTR